MHANPGHLHPTARRPPGLAWIGSLVVHAAALAALAWASQPAAQAPSLGRRLGALMVRLEAITTPPPNAPKPSHGGHEAASHRERDTPHPAQSTGRTPASPHTTGTTEAPRPDQPPAADPDSEARAPLAVPLATPASPPPAPPEARWGGLFAPFIRQPLGRGRWGGMAPPATAHQDQAALQQAQTIQAQRAALMQRLQSLGALLPQAPLMGHCQVQITLGSLDGKVSCDEAPDQNRVHAVLNDFLAPPLPPGAESAPRALTEPICLELQGHLIRWMPCSPTQTPSP